MRRFAHAFPHDFNAALAIVRERHLGSAWPAQPEMFHAVRRPGPTDDSAVFIGLRLRRLHHEDFAFAEIYQRSRAGRVSAFSEHVQLLWAGISLGENSLLSGECRCNFSELGSPWLRQELWLSARRRRVSSRPAQAAALSARRPIEPSRSGSFLLPPVRSCSWCVPLNS